MMLNINNSYKNPQSGYFSTKNRNTVYFGSVSSKDAKEAEEKNPVQRTLEETVDKVTTIANQSPPPKIDDNLKKVREEMYMKRLGFFSELFGFDSEIDGLERRQIEQELRKKGLAVEESMVSAQNAHQLATVLPAQLANFDPAKDIERNKRLESIRQVRASFDQLKGFSRIAGYEEEKDILEKHFIKEIKKEKLGEKAQVPGSVLFFGPTGNGKSTFAKAFAEETGCKLVYIEPDFELQNREKESSFISELQDEAGKAKKRFDKDKTRTILFVDETTKVADKTSSVLPEFEEFLQSCSDKCHCTVFAATNHPFNLGLDMSKEAIFPYRVSMNPPNSKNMNAVLGHYLNGRTSGELDYPTLTTALEKRGKEEKGAFSNSQIKQICLSGDNAIVSQEEILNRIKESSPAIDKEALEKFDKEEAQFMPYKI